MNPMERLNGYLRALEGRLRLAVLARGGALVLVAALAATMALVLVMNRYAFADPVVHWARVALFLALALAASLGVVTPLLALNRKFTARRAEQKFPEFKERLLTLAEQRAQEGNPFLELLAEDAMKVAEQAEPEALAPSRWIAGAAAAGVTALGVLVWMTVAGPGFLGYGASLLWAGVPRGYSSEGFYRIQVTPGDKKVRRGSDQIVTATLVGFEAPSARLLARYAGTTKWEPVDMQAQPGGPGFQFLFAGLAENVEYYVESKGVRSRNHTLSVVDLPAVKKIRVTYHFPTWTAMPAAVEDPGGDLRAVEGTDADVEVTTDRALAGGALMLDSGTRVPLEGNGMTVKGRVHIERDGMYYVAALEGGDAVRLSEDFFIEARKDEPPVVRVRRPGRDAKVLPVEEVTVEVEAEDDFGLEGMELTYSVNGAPEKTVPLLKTRHAKQADGSVLISLEDYKLSPGDVVSLYATARDARTTTRTDIYFIEAQAYEREFMQSQQEGGGGGGGGGDQTEISARQKEIISATWNQMRDTRDRSAAAENAKFLADVQGKLRDQAQSLARRMKSRQLSQENAEFQQFSKSMEAAAQSMQEAVGQLKTQGWKNALPPEQRALQNLLRAESIFRQIRVAFGQRGGGGGGGGAGRDLENLFDLELDTEKNQYETGQQVRSADQQAKDLEEAMRKLEELARRQQELARQYQNSKQNFQQRWQQEMLRREAEQLQRQMEQMSRGSSGQQQQGGPQQQSGRSGAAGGQQLDPRIDRALEQLRRATDEMRRAANPENGGDGRRAAERLQEAQDMLKGLRQQESTQQVDDLKQRADRLARDQQGFEEKMKQTYGGGQGMQSRSLGTASELAAEKQRLQEDLERLERDMQRAARDMQNSQRAAANKLRQGLGEMQENELGMRMKMNSEYIRRGYGPAVLNRETPITQGLQRLAQRVGEAAGALTRGDNDPKNQNSGAVERLEQLRNRLQQMAQAARGGQPGQQGQQPGGRQPGQPGERGQQAGQTGPQAGQPGQQPGQQGQREGQTGMGTRPYGGGPNEGPGRYTAMNRGDWQPRGSFGPWDPATAAREYREGLRDLSELRQSLGGDNAESARELQALLQEMQRLDPRRFPGNPEMIDRLLTNVLPSLEQIELQLRRQGEDKQSGEVRSGASDRVPAGYADSVAEYFRKLSKGR